MLGVILAAGKATRLPNKALLPIADGKIAIESAIAFCNRVAQTTLVVVDPARIIEEVLRRRGHRNLKFVVQPEPFGVTDAIARGAAAAENRELILVTFCDNVYDPEENVSAISNYASVRSVDSPQLDQWSQGKKKWIPRLTNDDEDDGNWNRGEIGQNPKFAGWMILQHSVAELGVPEENVLSFMNRHNVKPKEANHKLRWWDIGTVQSYKQYLSTSINLLPLGKEHDDNENDLNS